MVLWPRNRAIKRAKTEKNETTETKAKKAPSGICFIENDRSFGRSRSFVLLKMIEVWAVADLIPVSSGVFWFVFGCFWLCLLVLFVGFILEDTGFCSHLFSNMWE